MYILDVDEITAYVRDLIETDPIMRDIWIRGEVSSLFRSGAGHCYFTLSSSAAQIKCVLFKGNQRGILALPRQGDAILAHGRVTIYEAQGQHQLIVDNIAPEGAGLAQLQFEEMRRRLEAEGLFSEDRKRSLPTFPSVIGVVTSRQGAVWHDIQTVVARRYPLVQLILAASTVQGAEAPAALASGLRSLWDDARPDVIIIGRGGGSPEDLAAFNDEELARLIFASPVPIISAVGHETNLSISDLVADVRAPTPSVAAELAVPNGRELSRALAETLALAKASYLRRVEAIEAALLSCRRRLDVRNPTPLIERNRLDLDRLHERTQRSIRTSLHEHRQRVIAIHGKLTLLDPHAVLGRGYAVVTSEDGSRKIGNSNAARAAKTLRIAFQHGSVKARVEEAE